ncbi:MAG: hypothetical protein JST39_05915, partial [Bacteroidetes bacterium]|nr:hypothetical protein [Bacteroidota bacterium]
PPTTYEMTGAAYNNITNDSVLFKPNSGNYVCGDPNSIFVNGTNGYHSWDQRWQVQDTSFAKTWIGGMEPGAFGGTNPYVLSGLPKLPAVYAVGITADSSKRGNILVRIKGKASY